MNSEEHVWGLKPAVVHSQGGTRSGDTARRIRLRARMIILLLSITSSSLPALAQESGLRLGTIDFPTSGTPQAQEEFIVGVLALHSFWYDEARDHFIRASEIDPEFGMAYWGEAMTYDNALGTVPGFENEDLGEAVVARMDALDAQGALKWIPRERGYADVIRERFRAGRSPEQRRQAYAGAMDQLALELPDDDEANAFAALSFLALPTFDRDNALHVVTAASILEEIYERNPEHPGVLHYLIHAYDTATFARLGLRQARLYARIAPASSHALHMPSHIFRHLGMWEEVAASNEDSYQASVRWQERTGRPLAMRDYHALDWLLTAYLTLGRYDDAQGVVDELDVIQAEIRQRGEDAADFTVIAASMRAYYQSEAPSTR